MVVLGVTLRFVQKARADHCSRQAQGSRSRYRYRGARRPAARDSTCRPRRPGDVVQLAAGGMIPGDVGLLARSSSPSSLTGEASTSRADRQNPARTIPLLNSRNICFLGTSVEAEPLRGSWSRPAETPTSATWRRPSSIKLPRPASSAASGQFTWLMIRFMAVVVPLVFVIGNITKEWGEAFFFITVAVGLTPEMLPMIVTVCLSSAHRHVAQRVIVKRKAQLDPEPPCHGHPHRQDSTLAVDHIILEQPATSSSRKTTPCWSWRFSTAISRPASRTCSNRHLTARKRPQRRAVEPIQQELDEGPVPGFVRKIMSVVVKTPEGRTA